MAILHHHLQGNKANVGNRKLQNTKDLRTTNQVAGAQAQVEMPGHQLPPDPQRLVHRGNGPVRLVDFRAGPA